MEPFNERAPFDNDEIPYISPLVRKWMPDASEKELIEATENWRRFLLELYRIYQKREGGPGDVGTS